MRALSVRTLATFGLVVALALAVTAGMGPAFSRSSPGAEQETEPLRVEGAWARPGLKGGTSAVYLTLVNLEQRPVRLRSVQSEVADKAELHKTIMETSKMPDGTLRQTMRMEPVAGLAIPASGRVVLEPGGLHVMLMGLRRQLQPGDQLALVLQLEDGRSLSVSVPVQPAGPGSGAAHQAPHP